MYAPLSGILNLGLEMVSNIEVDGLPKFQNHIVFIPLDQRVASNRDVAGSLFKPDVILISLGTACDFFKIKYTRSLSVSDFVNRIVSLRKSAPSKNAKGQPKNKPPGNPPKTVPPRAPPSAPIAWENILLNIEVKRLSTKWPELVDFTATIPPITNKGPGEQHPPQGPNSETLSGTFGARTCKTQPFVG